VLTNTPMTKNFTAAHLLWLSLLESEEALRSQKTMGLPRVQTNETPSSHRCTTQFSPRDELEQGVPERLLLRCHPFLNAECL
jgi:hypothetical protein